MFCSFSISSAKGNVLTKAITKECSKKRF